MDVMFFKNHRRQVEGDPLSTKSKMAAKNLQVVKHKKLNFDNSILGKETKKLKVIFQAGMQNFMKIHP